MSELFKVEIPVHTEYVNDGYFDFKECTEITRDWMEKKSWTNFKRIWNRAFRKDAFHYDGHPFINFILSVYKLWTIVKHTWLSNDYKRIADGELLSRIKEEGQPDPTVPSHSQN